jgi:peroxiredoxin
MGTTARAITRTLPAMAGPEVGDRAPDALLSDIERREVRLSSLWTSRPAVVVFLRYFGCPFCQTQVVSLRNEHHRILDAGAEVGLVGHGDPIEAVEFATSKRLPFPLLLDRDRGAYRAYGLVQGRAMQVLSPRVALPWIKAELSAETRQRGLKGGRFLQMPGTFVIDTSGVVLARGGTIRMAHRNRHLADAPSIDRLLDALAEADRPT